MLAASLLRQARARTHCSSSKCVSRLYRKKWDTAHSANTHTEFHRVRMTMMPRLAPVTGAGVGCRRKSKT